MINEGHSTSDSIPENDVHARLVGHSSAKWSDLSRRFHMA